jgi:hypothetical protein
VFDDHAFKFVHRPRKDASFDHTRPEPQHCPAHLLGKDNTNLVEGYCVPCLEKGRGLFLLNGTDYEEATREHQEFVRNATIQNLKGWTYQELRHCGWLVGEELHRVDLSYPKTENIKNHMITVGAEEWHVVSKEDLDKFEADLNWRQVKRTLFTTKAAQEAFSKVNLDNFEKYLRRKESAAKKKTWAEAISKSMSDYDLDISKEIYGEEGLTIYDSKGQNSDAGNDIESTDREELRWLGGTSG